MTGSKLQTNGALLRTDAKTDDEGGGRDGRVEKVQPDSGNLGNTP